MSIITISSIFNFEYDDYKAYCNTVISDFITTTPYEDTLNLYIYLPVWLRYRDTPIKFNNDDKGKDDFLRNFNNQLTEVVFDFHNYAKENIEYFLYQNDTTKQGKPMSKTITSGIAPINQTIDQSVDDTNLASGTGSQFVSETVYNGVAWHKLVEGYFTPNRKTALLKAFQWLFISVYNPETKYNDKIGIKATVPLDMADGDQVIVPDKDYLTYDQVTVEKPDTMIPENILKDIDIGGVVGTFEVKIYPRIYDLLRLDNPDGVIVYNTPSGYDGLEGITITIPDTAVAENIKLGVNIGGIIGTYAVDNQIVNRVNNNSTQPYSINDDRITSFREYAFYKDTNLTSGIFNSVETLDEYIPQLFDGCSNLTSLTFNNLTSFYNANSPSYIFRGTTNLSTFNAPLLTKIRGTYLFINSGIETIYLPSLTEVYGQVFRDATNLKTLNLPQLTTINNSICTGCTSLTNVTMPLVTALTNFCFENCSSLQTLVLNVCSSIGNGVFRNSNMTNLTLGYTGGVCTLGNVSSFANIGHQVTIHVPSSLISSYQTATNWSTLYNNGDVVFVAI